MYAQQLLLDLVLVEVLRLSGVGRYGQALAAGYIHLAEASVVWMWCASSANLGCWWLSYHQSINGGSDEQCKKVFSGWPMVLCRCSSHTFCLHVNCEETHRPAKLLVACHWDAFSSISHLCWFVVWSSVRLFEMLVFSENVLVLCGVHQGPHNSRAP